MSERRRGIGKRFKEKGTIIFEEYSLCNEIDY